MEKNDEKKGADAAPKPDNSVGYVRGAKKLDACNELLSILRSGGGFKNMEVSFWKDYGEYSFRTHIHAEFIDLKILLADMNSNLSCFLNGGKPPTEPFSFSIKREAYDSDHTLAVFIPKEMKEKIPDNASLASLLNKNNVYKQELVSCSVFISKEKVHTGVAAVCFKSPDLVDHIVNRGTIVVQLENGREYFLRVRRFASQRSHRAAHAKQSPASLPIWNVLKTRTAQATIHPVVFQANDSLSFMKDCIDLHTSVLEKMKEQYYAKERQEKVKELLLTNPSVLSDMSNLIQENNILRSLCEKGNIPMPARAECSVAMQKLLVANTANPVLPAPHTQTLVSPLSHTCNTLSSSSLSTSGVCTIPPIVSLSLSAPASAAVSSFATAAVSVSASAMSGPAVSLSASPVSAMSVSAISSSVASAPAVSVSAVASPAVTAASAAVCSPAVSVPDVSAAIPPNVHVYFDRDLNEEEAVKVTAQAETAKNSPTQSASSSGTAPKPPDKLLRNNRNNGRNGKQ